LFTKPGYILVYFLKFSPVYDIQNTTWKFDFTLVLKNSQTSASVNALTFNTFLAFFSKAATTAAFVSLSQILGTSPVAKRLLTSSIKDGLIISLSANKNTPDLFFSPHYLLTFLISSLNY